MLYAGWLGTLPGWLTVIGIAVATATFLRGSRSTAITNLKIERDELDRECKRLVSEVAALKATRDLSSVQEAMVAALMSHEARAQDRWEKTSKALDRHLVLTEMIAERLGPDASS